MCMKNEWIILFYISFRTRYSVFQNSNIRCFHTSWFVATNKLIELNRNKTKRNEWHHLMEFFSSLDAGARFVVCSTPVVSKSILSFIYWQRQCLPQCTWPNQHLPLCRQSRWHSIFFAPKVCFYLFVCNNATVLHTLTW